VVRELTENPVQPTSLIVSVVMPNLNKGSCPRCLESILNQDCRAIESIVVDNGSTDGSLAFAEEY